MFNKRYVLAGLFLFLMAGNVLAYRPLGTEDAGVAGKGVAQTEISWDYLKWDNDELDHENVFLLVPIYGVTENLEASMEIPYLIHDLKVGDSEDGIGDINLVAKYLLIKEGERNPAFAVKGAVKIDNGDYDRGLGSGDKDYSLFAVASKTISQVTVHGHAGYTLVGDKKDKNLRNITLYGLAIDYALTEPLHILAEINGNRHPDSTAEEDDPRNALAGITYKVSDSLTLDAGYRWGLSDSVPDWSTTVGVSIAY
ncbi:MAG: transporter [Deltaproteobacteria bacterium]|nr:transporter [Deltaproteobacteria bacterium]